MDISFSINVLIATWNLVRKFQQSNTERDQLKRTIDEFLYEIVDNDIDAKDMQSD